MTHINVGGFVAPGWEPVKAAFETNFELGEETWRIGCGLPPGRQRWSTSGAGRSTLTSDRPYDDSTLQLVFCTTKGITAIAVAMCVQRGLLDYDEKVAIVLARVRRARQRRTPRSRS